MSIKTWLLGKALGWLSWKLVAAIMLSAVTAVGALYLNLRVVRAERDAARAEAVVAKTANQTNLDTIKELERANLDLANVVRFNTEKRRELEADAERIKANAERDRRELARLRELDRRSPDCAALLDRSLSACPDLVRRLWPDADRPN